jgi:integrase
MLPRDGGARMARREYQNPPLKKSKGPRPFWYIRYRRKVLQGKNIVRVQKQQSLGYCDEVGKREAERLRDEILRQINREVYTIQSHIPFQDFVHIWKEKHLPTVTKGTRDKYVGHLKNHILPAFGKLKLCEVGDTELLQVFINGKEADGMGWWTRVDLRNILSSIFTKADDWGYWRDRNPVERVVMGRKRPKREKRLLTDEQFLQLLDALPSFVTLICLIADSTGLRISEVLGLKWKNVDEVTGWLQIRERWYRGDQDVTKTEKSNRDVPVGALVDDLRRLKPLDASPDGYMFDRCDGQPYDDRGLLRRFIRPAAKKLGFYWKGFGFHSLRRGNITIMQSVAGASTIETQINVGHSRPMMTAEYTILQRNRQEELVRKVQERLDVIQ